MQAAVVALLGASSAACLVAAARLVSVARRLEVIMSERPAEVRTVLRRRRRRPLSTDVERHAPIGL